MRNPKQSNKSLKIIILGYIVRGPLGGLAWHHLQYLAGLIHLGHSVHFVEYSNFTEHQNDYPSCYDPTKNKLTNDPTFGLKFLEAALKRLNLPQNWCYFDASKGACVGPDAKNIIEISKTCDLLLNISLVNPIKSYFNLIPKRIAIDTDPVFTQARALNNSHFRKLLLQHNVFFTFGENYGQNNCGTPNDGFLWRPTRQPIFLNAWKPTIGPNSGSFTTVMQWDSYERQHHEGQSYGMKSETFPIIIDLPKKTDEVLEIALGGNNAPHQKLKDKGWKIADPLSVTHDPWTYQAYLTQSKAELSVAKHGYVVTNSGWFSERSAAYLASCRPVIVQDTGFSKNIPTGQGLFGFRSEDHALEAIEEISKNYVKHCKWARALAEQHFNSDRVLSKLIEDSFALTAQA